MPELPLIPGYRIERELGSGGMATVYLGVQEKLNRRVAIKVLNPLLLVDPNFAKRFIKEAETAAGLTHSGIVHIYDMGQAGTHYYIVMEYLEGGSLKDRIKCGALDPDEALKITRQVASALQHAHDEGYVHRDIKPDNIMFRKDGTLVITDFGIARAVDSATKLTKTGMSIGTPHYMSPEQARSKQLDGRSDIYSLGCVLYEMLTGKVPYEADDSVGVIIKHIQEPIPQLPASLAKYQAVIERMMAKDREQRVCSAFEVCRLLEMRPQTDSANAAQTFSASQIASAPPGPPRVEPSGGYEVHDRRRYYSEDLPGYEPESQELVASQPQKPPIEHGDVPTSTSELRRADGMPRSATHPDVQSPIPTIPRYRIDEEIGEDEFRAYQEETGRMVALKVLRPPRARIRLFVELLIQEAEITRKLDHPNIVKIYDSGCQDNVYYVASEYAESGSLRELVQRGPLDPVKALTILRQASSALQHAHQMGHPHLDIKPENIRLRRDGSVVIGGFGIGGVKRQETECMEWTPIGTPHYMSPEQIRGKQPDGRSDIYSLGVVLYEMLTGKVPYDAEDSVGICVKHIQQPMPKLPLHLKRFQELLEGMLAKEELRRIPSCIMLHQLIDALLFDLVSPDRMSEQQALKDASLDIKPKSSRKGKEERHYEDGSTYFGLRSASYQQMRGDVGNPWNRPSWTSTISVAPSGSGSKSDNGAAGLQSRDQPPSVLEMAENIPRRSPLVFGLLFVLIVLMISLIVVLSQNGGEKPQSATPVAQTAATLASSQRSTDGRFTDNGDGTVTDSQTGLMWAARDNGSNINWDEARRYCENCTAGGYKDWRMPTIEELRSIYDSKSSQPVECGGVTHCILCIDLSCFYVWSSKTKDFSSAFLFDFDYGFRIHEDTDVLWGDRSHSEHDRALPVRSR